MTELTTVETNILNILSPYRIEKFVDFESIRKRSGHSRRSLQKHLESLKRKGHPIGSLKRETWHGLYLARNLQELEPGMSDLRESGSIEQDADIVAFLYRDDYYQDKKDDQPEKNLTELIIKKNRHGDLGTVKMYFHKEYTKFTNMEE